MPNWRRKRLAKHRKAFDQKCLGLDIQIAYNKSYWLPWNNHYVVTVSIKNMVLSPVFEATGYERMPTIKKAVERAHQWRQNTARYLRMDRYLRVKGL